MAWRKIFLISICAALVYGDAMSQKQANIWYFGRNQGLDFNPGAPVALNNSSMSTFEGCASLADTAGNLLMYTDGVTIWDSSHNVMMNGAGLKGDESATQSGIIVPYPANPDLYYVFTVDEQLRTFPSHRGFHYNLVDMRLNAGLGKVTLKNQKLLGNVTEKVTGVSHCNNGDIWVVTHGWNNNNFYSYLVKSTGLRGIPVISSVGMIHGGIPGNSLGYMKASPDGRRIACAIGLTDRVQVFDFNAETGVVSNTTTFIYPASFSPYGLEFSPNGDLLYTGSSNQGLSQIDLVTNTTAHVAIGKVNALQLAPDGKIYAATGPIKVINNPDVIGVGCNFTSSPVTALSSEGLPTFNQSIFNLDPFQNFTFSDTCFQDTTNFEFNSTANTDSIIWDFGDPASAQNIGRGRTPKHLYSQPGMYTVKLSVYSINCPVPFVIEKDLNIDPLPQVMLPPDTTICDYDSILVEAILQDVDQFFWSDLNDSDTNRYLEGPETFTLSGFNACGSESDEFSIDVYERIEVDIPNQVLCEGDSIRLNAFFQGATYLWQDGSINPTFMVRQPGEYRVSISTVCYDTLIKVQIFRDVGRPIVNLGNDTSICVGDTLVLNVGHYTSSYLWQDGSTDSVFKVSEAGRYFVEVKFACYRDVDTIDVTMHPKAEVDIGNDTIVCFNRPYVIKPKTEDSLFRWQDGTADNRFVATEEGIYYVTTENKCGVDSDTLQLLHDFPPELSLPPDTTFCEGRTVSFRFNLPRATFLWQDQSTESFYDIREPGLYSVRARNACGDDRATIEAFTKDCSCTVFAPSAFSPNNDQLNNTFQVAYDCDLLRFHLQVYDRWGKLVYETKNPDGKWDGTEPNGERAALGVYVYKVDYTGMRDDQQFHDQLSGTLTLIR